MLLSYIEKKIKNVALSLDQRYFINNTRNQRIGAIFFYYTSSITKFFFFNSFGYIIFTLFASYSMFYLTKQMKDIVMYIASCDLITGIINMFFLLPFSFICFLVFYSVLTYLAIINTVLVEITSVNNYIKNKYGENFIKLQCYNALGFTLSKAITSGKILAALAGGAVVGGTFAGCVDSGNYRQNYKDYLDALLKGANPEPPARGIIGPNFGFFKR